MVQLETSQLAADVPLGASKDVQGDEDPNVMECSTDEASTSECDSRSSSVERTASQTSAQKQIEGVSERIEERKGTVQKLLQSITELSCEGDVQTLQESEKLLDIDKKQARNLGEDLLEDLLALDGLSGLIPEDRNRRKAAIVGINLLLEDVDASKVRLAALQKQIHRKCAKVGLQKNRIVLHQKQKLCPVIEVQGS